MLKDGRDLSITFSVQTWYTRIAYEHKMTGRNVRETGHLKVIPYPSATRCCVLALELVVLGDCLTALIVMFVDFENDSSFAVLLSSHLVCAC